MKLWKNKKTTSCVPGKSSSSIGKNEDSRLESANSSTTVSGIPNMFQLTEIDTIL